MKHGILECWIPALSKKWIFALSTTWSSSLRCALSLRITWKVRRHYHALEYHTHSGVQILVDILKTGESRDTLTLNKKLRIWQQLKRCGILEWWILAVSKRSSLVAKWLETQKPKSIFINITQLSKLKYVD